MLLTNGAERWAFRHEVGSLAFVPWLFPDSREEDYRWIVAAIVSHHKDADRIKFLESLISHSLPAFQITKASLINLNQTDQPFGYQYSLTAQNYAKTAGNLLLVRTSNISVYSMTLVHSIPTRSSLRSSTYERLWINL